MNKKLSMTVLIILAAAIVLSVLLYFFAGNNLLYVKLALLILGVLNVFNGVVALYSKNRGMGIFLVSCGVVLCAVMIVALFI